MVFRLLVPAAVRIQKSRVRRPADKSFRMRTILNAENLVMTYRVGKVDVNAFARGLACRRGRRIRRHHGTIGLRQVNVAAPDGRIVDANQRSHSGRR